MLKPAILYKDQITRKLQEIVYSDDFFYYSGIAHDHDIPDVKLQNNMYYWAVVDSKDNVIGCIIYRIHIPTDCAYSFGIISFDKGNILLPLDLVRLLTKLIHRHHRVEWRMIGNNPVKPHYDKFCMKYGGRILHLKDASVDLDGNYVDDYIYEIIYES